jgi:hypothetical protein
MLRRMLKPKKKKVTGGWKRPYSEDNMGGSCSTNGEMRNVYKILVRKTEMK